MKSLLVTAFSMSDSDSGTPNPQEKNVNCVKYKKAVDCTWLKI